LTKKLCLNHWEIPLSMPRCTASQNPEALQRSAPPELFHPLTLRGGRSLRVSPGVDMKDHRHGKQTENRWTEIADARLKVAWMICRRDDLMVDGGLSLCGSFPEPTFE